LKEWYFQN